MGSLVQDAVLCCSVELKMGLLIVGVADEQAL